MTVPGAAADVCGVNVIFSPFFSYAVYEVSLGGEETGGAGAGVWVCGMEKALMGAVAGVAGML